MARIARSKSVINLREWVQQLTPVVIFCLLSLQPMVCSAQQGSNEAVSNGNEQAAANSRVDGQQATDTAGTTSTAAIELSLVLNTIDSERAAFVKRYFGKQWPTRPLYHVMLNTLLGDEICVSTIVGLIEATNRSLTTGTSRSSTAQ